MLRRFFARLFGRDFPEPDLTIARPMEVNVRAKVPLDRVTQPRRRFRQDVAHHPAHNTQPQEDHNAGSIDPNY